MHLAGKLATNLQDWFAVSIGPLYMDLYMPCKAMAHTTSGGEQPSKIMFNMNTHQLDNKLKTWIDL